MTYDDFTRLRAWIKADVEALLREIEAGAGWSPGMESALRVVIRRCTLAAEIFSLYDELATTLAMYQKDRA